MIRVELPRGGSLTIEPTSALISVDINSGKNIDKNGALETNRFAMLELPRTVETKRVGWNYKYRLSHLLRKLIDH